MKPVIMQIILSVVALMSAERLWSRWQRRTLGRGTLGLWFIGLLFILLLVWRPELADKLSRFVGVGRGVDAVVYISIAVIFYLVLRIFIRLEKQEDLLTRLTTEIALGREQHKK